LPMTIIQKLQMQSLKPPLDCNNNVSPWSNLDDLVSY